MIEEQIDQFIKSGKKILDLPMMPVKEIERLLKALGYKWRELTGDEINGWSVDFWYYFDKEGAGSLCFTGSLHSGDFQLIKGGPATDNE